MIPLLAIASAPKWLKWGGIALVLLAVLGVYLTHRNAIYQDGYRAAWAQAEEQARKQIAANNAAVKRATDRLRHEADELAKTRTEYEDALKQLDEASNADPDGGNIAIGSDSVRRLNEAVGYGPNPSP